MGARCRCSPPDSSSPRCGAARTRTSRAARCSCSCGGPSGSPARSASSRGPASPGPRASRWRRSSALAAWIAIGMTRGDALERELIETVRTLGFAGIAAAGRLDVRPARLARAAGFVVLAAVIVCILAFASRLLPSVFPSAVEEVGIDSRRLAYPLNYWNAVGVWAAMTVSMTLAWSAHAARWWVRGLALAAVCVAVPVAYMTYSRTAAIVTILAAIVVVALSAHRWLAALNVLAAAGRLSGRDHHDQRAPARSPTTPAPRARGPSRSCPSIVALACVALSYAAAAAGVDGVPAPPTDREGVARDRADRLAGAGSSSRARALPTERGTASTSPRRRRTRPDAAGRLTNLSGERRVLWDVALDTFSDSPALGIRRRNLRVRVEPFAAVDAHGPRRPLDLPRAACRDRPSRRPARHRRASARCSWPRSSRPSGSRLPAAPRCRGRTARAPSSRSSWRRASTGCGNPPPWRCSPSCAPCSPPPASRAKSPSRAPRRRVVHHGHGRSACSRC